MDTTAEAYRQPDEEAVSEEASRSSYDLSDDEHTARKQYYLSLQEIPNHTDTQIYEMDNDIAFEERVALSSIVCTHEIPSSMPPLTGFSFCFQRLTREFNNSIAHNVPMDLTLLSRVSAHEQRLACMLLSTSDSIRKQATTFNHGKDSELNFIAEEVAPFLEAIFCNSKLTLEWDVIPNYYKYCELDVRLTRHDFIIFARDGTEIGTGEVKPCQASDALVQLDRCRIAETCKKQLHQRLLAARSTKELYTYGIMISGHKIELSALHLTTTGEYRYSTIYDIFLPTAQHTYAFMQETLTKMLRFVHFMEDSLLNPQEMHDKLILPNYSSFLKPTVYMVA